MRSWIYHDLLHLSIVVQEQKKKRDGIASIHPPVSSKRDCIKVMKMKSNGARETSRFLFQTFLLKRRRGREKKSKKSEWQRKQERRNEIEYWRSVEIRGSSWIASDHRSQRSCPELSNPGFLTHTCNIHRDIFAFHHRRRDAISARLEILRCRNSSISRSFFFFFILLEIDPAGSSFSGEIFLSPTWIQESYFESRTSGERRRSVKYFKVSMWDFLNCSPSGIGMNAEVEEFWWMLCAEFQWFEDIWRMWRWMESSVAGWKLWEILVFYGPVLFIR